MVTHNAEIGAFARKLQRRLPSNRIVRDQDASHFIPRNRNKHIDTINSNPFSPPRQANLSKVLVIDERRDARSSLTNLLCRFYSILESGDLEEALRITRISRPSLIILGSFAVKKESIGFCRKLKSDTALWHIPVLALLSQKVLDESAAIVKAADDYLKLPLQSAELLVAVENLVDVRRYLKAGGIKRPVINTEDSTTQISDGMFLEAVHTVVENNLSNSLFGLETLAQEVNVTVRQLHGQIRKLTGLSPAGFIRTKRLKHAIDLLSRGRVDVPEVARSTGFHSTAHFLRVFKQANGVFPQEFNSTA